VLVAVTGSSSQVVPETLYGLLYDQSDLFLDEIRIITTIQGKQRLLESPLSLESGAIHSVCEEFNIPPKSISFNNNSITILCDKFGNPLVDIITAQDNEAAEPDKSAHTKTLRRS